MASVCVMGPFARVGGVGGVKMRAKEMFINIAITDWTLSLAEFCV